MDYNGTERERERERERATTYRRRHTHRRTVMHTCDDEGKNDLVREGVRYGQRQADMDTRRSIRQKSKTKMQDRA